MGKIERAAHAAQSGPKQKAAKTKNPPAISRRRVFLNCIGGFVVLSVLGRPGSVLLSRGLSRSTMDAEGFDGRVRNGIG